MPKNVETTKSTGQKQGKHLDFQNVATHIGVIFITQLSTDINRLSRLIAHFVQNDMFFLGHFPSIEWTD